MRDAFVFDIETDRLLTPSRDNWRDLRITAVVGIDPQGTAHEFVFMPNDAAAEADAVLRIGKHLDSAVQIVAYNGREFDLRVLENYFEADRVESWLAKLVDPFEVIRATTGSWVKLDELLDANGLQKKGGTGVDAVQWWKDGQINRVVDYCRHDVFSLWSLVTQFKVLRFPVKVWEGGEQRVVKWSRLRWHDYVAFRNIRQT
jgi:hypothetical protein